MHLALQSQRNSQVYYGSEFRPTHILSSIFGSHPLWKYTESILSSGASFPLHPIPSGIRNEDIQFHKDRGKHKSASKFHHILSTIIKEDVERGFALPLPVELLPLIPNASLAPLGCQEQTTINALGERIPKYRLTHDQSFPGPSGSSVNLRVDPSKLPPIMYGFCLNVLYIIYWDYDNVIHPQRYSLANSIMTPLIDGVICLPKPLTKV